MNKVLTLITLSLFLCIATTHAQDHRSYAPPSGDASDILELGFGFGQDYGGFGGNITVYPQKNIGLFGGFGFALAGFGYNAGLKLRLLPNDGESKVHPFIEGMYGYNAAIYIANATQNNKMFYGTTFGAGIDVLAGADRKGCFSLALLVPIRSPDVQSYIDNLRDNYGVSFKSSLIPVSFSIGYKIIIQ